MLKTLSVSISVLATAAVAQPILVDFGDGAANPTFGGVWNTVDSALSGTALVDSAGAATGVVITFGGDGWIDASLDQGAWPAGDTDWVAGDSTADYTFNVGGDTSTVTYSGLNPGQAYRFDHVAARALGSDRIADYLVNGSFADTTPNGDDFASLADGWDGGNILRWDSVIADGSGQITMTVTDVRGFGYLSASRIEIVPAPASAVLLGLGGLVATRRRR